MGRQLFASHLFLDASKIIATLSKNRKEKIQPSIANTTAEQVVQNHKSRGRKNPFWVIFALIFAAKPSGNECC